MTRSCLLFHRAPSGVVTSSPSSINSTSHPSSQPSSSYDPDPDRDALNRSSTEGRNALRSEKSCSTPSIRVALTPGCQNGYSRNGYSQNGYSQSGYSHNGYSQNGYSQNGSMDWLTSTGGCVLTAKITW